MGLSSSSPSMQATSFLFIFGYSHMHDMCEKIHTGFDLMTLNVSCILHHTFYLLSFPQYLQMLQLAIVTVDQCHLFGETMASLDQNTHTIHLVCLPKTSDYLLHVELKEQFHYIPRHFPPFETLQWPHSKFWIMVQRLSFFLQ